MYRNAHWELINKYKKNYTEIKDLVCVYEKIKSEMGCQDFLKNSFLYSIY